MGLSALDCRTPYRQLIQCCSNEHIIFLIHEALGNKLSYRYIVTNPSFLNIVINPSFLKLYASSMHQSIPAASIPPPPGQLRGICAPCQFRGWGISKFGTARESGICLPRGCPRGFDTLLEIQTWRILSQRTSNSSQIGSTVMDWTN